jgi:hypothetical protein
MTTDGHHHTAFGIALGGMFGSGSLVVELLTNASSIGVKVVTASLISFATTLVAREASLLWERFRGTKPKS